MIQILVMKEAETMNNDRDLEKIGVRFVRMDGGLYGRFRNDWLVDRATWHAVIRLKSD